MRLEAECLGCDQVAELEAAIAGNIDALPGPVGGVGPDPAIFDPGRLLFGRTLQPVDPFDPPPMFPPTLYELES